MANGEIQNFAIPEGTPVSAPTASPITVAVANVLGFAAAVVVTVLTGYVIGLPVAIAATDTILQAFGKLQAQLDSVYKAQVTVAVTNSSNVTLVSISELAFPVVSGREYKIDIYLMHRTASSAAGLAVTMAATGAVGTIALTASMIVAADGTAAAYHGSIISFGDIVTGSGLPTGTPDFYICHLYGIFVCTTSGTLTPQFRSEVNAQQQTIGAGSSIEVREFA